MKPKETATTAVVVEKKETVEECDWIGCPWRKIYKKEWDKSDPRQKLVQYAFEIGGFDLVYLVECENATWNIYRQSEVVQNGRREPSYWLCMIDRDFHKDIIDNPKFWESWQRQLDRCKELRDNWTPFYWPTRNVNWKQCHNYVKDRFYFE